MKYLIVYAHPNPASFNHAILETVKENLLSEGHEVEIRDLYKMKFKPVLDSFDFEAIARGTVSGDVAKEQAKIAEADRLVFIYPIWWWGMPAILKGYIDRVFTHGFAYKVTAQGPVCMLSTKNVSIINTTGGPEEGFPYESLKRTSEEGIFGFCGLQTHLHKYYHSILTITEADRKRILEDVKTLKL